MEQENITEKGRNQDFFDGGVNSGGISGENVMFKTGEAEYTKADTVIPEELEYDRQYCKNAQRGWKQSPYDEK